MERQLRPSPTVYVWRRRQQRHHRRNRTMTSVIAVGALAPMSFEHMPLISLLNIFDCCWSCWLLITLHTRCDVHIASAKDKLNFDHPKENTRRRRFSVVMYSSMNFRVNVDDCDKSQQCPPSHELVAASKHKYRHVIFSMEATSP